jgi:predicted O-methyltransferase YrrM
MFDLRLPDKNFRQDEKEDMTENTLTVAPMRDVTALSRVPGPFRNAYRVLFPEELRIRVHGLLLHVDDMMRTATFWANPWERKRSRAELWSCQTPEDCYTFATAHMAHQQWKQEILGLLNFANAQRPVRICELGLFLGGTNLMLTHALPDVKQIIGVDMWIRNKSQLKYYKKRSQQQTLITGKTCDERTLEKVAGALNGEKLDLLLIDADHSYEGAKADFLQYRHFVREGGIIAFHDIVQDHLTRYRHDPATFVGSRSGEVYLLWRRLKACYGDTREFVANYDQDGCGIGALVYSSKVDVPDNL